MVDKLAELAKTGFSRRGFLAGAGAASAATLVGCGSSTPAPLPLPTPAGLTDVDVLNFALNLEYLEAEFYMRAATGTGIPDADRLGGPAPTVIASTKVNFQSNYFQQIANELAQTELQHVRAIQAAIGGAGGTPIAMPQIDYTAGFGAVSAAAGLTGFNPFADAFSFFVGALTFEDVGVTAYTGAASLITSAAILSAAAGIQAAESYHAGTLRTILVGAAIATGVNTYVNNYNAIIKVRSALDGAANETTLVSGGINADGSVTPSSIVAADSTNSIAFPRTTDQVLHIVYGKGAGVVSSGGFFPNGVNGTLATLKATAA